MQFSLVKCDNQTKLHNKAWLKVLVMLYCVLGVSTNLIWGTG